MSRPRYLLPVAIVMSLVLAACGPTTTDLSALTAPCATTPTPTVAVIEFENTTGSGGTTVVGVETAATARLTSTLSTPRMTRPRPKMLRRDSNTASNSQASRHRAARGSVQLWGARSTEPGTRSIAQYMRK